jgi:hypothetical protein
VRVTTKSTITLDTAAFRALLDVRDAARKQGAHPPAFNLIGSTR